VELNINTLNAELNPICHLLALLGAHPILHVSKIRLDVVHRENYLYVFYCPNLYRAKHKNFIRKGGWARTDESEV